MYIEPVLPKPHILILGRSLVSGITIPPVAPETAKDPICGMSVDIAKAKHISEFEDAGLFLLRWALARVRCYAREIRVRRPVSLRSADL